MPSNGMHICITCRVGGKNIYPSCLRDGHNTMYLGSRISVPKKTNTRAWKRIEDGEILWNRRKTRRHNHRDTTTVFEMEKVPVEITEDDCEHSCCNMFRPLYRQQRVPGSGKEITNYNRTPDIDLGG